MASSYGKLPDASLDGMARVVDTQRQRLVTLETIDREALSENDKVTWDVLRWQLSEQIVAILTTPGRAEDMRKSALSHALPDATDRLVALVTDLSKASQP